jgi:hypothetical protein
MSRDPRRNGSSEQRSWHSVRLSSTPKKPTRRTGRCSAPSQLSAPDR